MLQGFLQKALHFKAEGFLLVSKGGDQHFLDAGPLLLMVLLSTYHMSVLAEGPSLATFLEGLVRWKKH